MLAEANNHYKMKASSIKSDLTLLTALGDSSGLAVQHSMCSVVLDVHDGGGDCFEAVTPTMSGLCHFLEEFPLKNH